MEYGQISRMYSQKKSWYKTMQYASLSKYEKKYMVV